MRISRDFFLGASSVVLAYLMRRHIKKAAVALGGELINLSEKSRETYYNLKEELEDIVAEAGYEHIKTKVSNNPDRPEENIQ